QSKDNIIMIFEPNGRLIYNYTFQIRSLLSTKSTCEFASFNKEVLNSSRIHMHFIYHALRFVTAPAQYALICTIVAAGER
ncbi:hypothetical protein QUG97_27440, partial [Klebsiella michiganensis]|uniref:hypothetical protein n=2 Tax=Klebsiella michiganensis TaxID=1134687 RepID=UPI0025A17C9D